MATTTETEKGFVITTDSGAPSWTSGPSAIQPESIKVHLASNPDADETMEAYIRRLIREAFTAYADELEKVYAQD